MTELARAQQAVVTALVRHSTYSHRASTAAVNRVWNEVEQIGQDVLDDLPELLAALGPAERQAFIHEDLEAAGLQPLLARIDQAVADIQAVVSREWSKSADGPGGHQPEFLRDARGGGPGHLRGRPHPGSALRGLPASGRRRSCGRGRLPGRGRGLPGPPIRMKFRCKEIGTED